MKRRLVAIALVAGLVAAAFQAGRSVRPDGCAGPAVTPVRAWRQETERTWVEWGLPVEAARRVVRIKEPSRSAFCHHDGSRQEGQVLAVLRDFGCLERYCAERGLAIEEAHELMARGRRR